MSSEEPPPPTDVDPTLTVPSAPEPQPAATAAADVPVDPPTDPDPDPNNPSSVHENPPQSDTPTAPSQPPPAADASSIILSPIPKKSSVSSDQIAESPASQTRSDSFDNGASSSLNLPEGVVLPSTVTPALINKVTGSLKIAFYQVRCFLSHFCRYLHWLKSSYSLFVFRHDFLHLSFLLPR